HPHGHSCALRRTEQLVTSYPHPTAPRHLCAPVRNNGAAIKNPSGYFLCYRAQLSLAAPQDALGPARQLHTNNEFGPGRLAAIRQAELCVPSVRTPAPRGCFSRDSSPTGFDAIVAAGFTMIDTGTDPG